MISPRRHSVGIVLSPAVGSVAHSPKPALGTLTIPASLQLAPPGPGITTIPSLSSPTVHSFNGMGLPSVAQLIPQDDLPADRKPRNKSGLISPISLSGRAFNFSDSSSVSSLRLIDPDAPAAVNGGAVISPTPISGSATAASIAVASTLPVQSLLGLPVQAGNGALRPVALSLLSAQPIVPVTANGPSLAVPESGQIRFCYYINEGVYGSFKDRVLLGESFTPNVLWSKKVTDSMGEKQPRTAR